jgi:hypothetical protein
LYGIHDNRRIPLTKISTRVTEDEMPFVYRLTNRGEGSVGVEVGDAFEPAEDLFERYPTPALAQIGLDMVSKGLQFMGVDGTIKQSLLLLILGGIDGEDAIEFYDEDWVDED